ncbi:MAG TPA: ABC transporter permease [Vicinamibacterales bacterium]|nr:ABC transporter permease [Vicinamibacterales bacterium]
MWRNLGQLLRYRGLIQSLVARELKARYRGSALGFFWSFVNPLLLLLIYSIVFDKFLQNRALGVQPYALFLFAGLLPWTWFSTALNESAGVLISGGNLIKKVLFPAEVLPIVSVLTNMVHFFFGLPILGVFLAYYIWSPAASVDPATGQVIVHQVALHWQELVWLPVVILVQLMLTTGLALLLSSITVLFRDIRDILANLLTFWFFATPIIYSWRDLPQLKRWFDFNPFTHLAVSYQEILFFPDNAFGHRNWLLALGAASVVMFLVGYWVFDRLRDTFAEAV